MLDTVRVGVGVQLDLGTLQRRGWGLTVRTSPEGEWDARADCVTSEGVRLGYGAGFGWLSAEASLPALVFGDNAQLLDWAGCVRGLEAVQRSACDTTGVTLPDVGEWRLARADSVWAWAVSPAPYLGAVRWARLPRTEARSFAGSVAWVTRGGGVRGRCYDKGAEAGHSVALPLRLERQTRPRREVLRVEGRRFPVVVGELTPRVVEGVLTDTVKGLGLDKDIPSSLEARRLLVEAYGDRRGRNLWRVLREAQDFGGWPSDIPTRTRRRYEGLLRGAGVRSLSWEGSLAALPAPSLH